MYSKISSLLFASFLLMRTASGACPSEKRIEIAERVPYAYNLTPLGASAAAFKNVPFTDDCTFLIFPNGAPVGIPTAVDGNSAYAFAVATRQLFSEVTGEYTDRPDINAAIIHTNVTLGVRNEIPIPVTFTADVFLDYTDDCGVKGVRAYATVPTKVLGLLINPPALGNTNPAQ